METEKSDDCSFFLKAFQVKILLRYLQNSEDCTPVTIMEKKGKPHDSRHWGFVKLDMQHKSRGQKEISGFILSYSLPLNIL